MSSSGLDTLPHNGAVITLLLVCGMTHRTSYLDIFVVSVIGPIVATAVVVTLGTLFPALVLGG
jgi:H+/gluconate symporter-like permease